MPDAVRDGANLWGSALVLIVILAPRLQAAGDADHYAAEIKPLLERKCYTCHGALRQRSGLRLDTAASIRKGGSLGPAIEPGDSEASVLIDAVTGSNGMTRMPPEEEGEPLSEAEIALLRAWIDNGAPAPEAEQPQADPREHWSFHSPERPPVPHVTNVAWVRNPVDAFIAAEHERQGLAPNPPAGRAMLLRRVSLDLIGVPPTRAELHAFLADSSPRAYEAVVDRLLESPQYGERWGRHWMDVWRYSDWYGSRGANEIRYSQRHIWRWRDWIIESLNADKGYDRMILEMLAGDEIAPTDADVLRATGFLGRNWYKFNRNVWLQEAVEQTSMAFLGETLKCARCHDHKFDPISQEEYYRFRAFFEPHEFRTDRVPGQPDVLQDGLARAFDQNLDAPTYLFVRGDDRHPDEDHPLAPGVPNLLDATGVELEPVSLPVEGYYPSLRPFVLQERVAQAEADVGAAVATVTETRSRANTLRSRIAELAAEESTGREPSDKMRFLSDDFASPRPDVWTTGRGRWEYAEGRLAQRQVTDFAMLVSKANHPRNFKARVRYVTTGEGTFRSVGLSFDVVEEQAFQAVYTSANDNRPTVQAFHRQAGRDQYPAAGIVACPAVRVGEEIALDVEVRGSNLKVAVNGAPHLDYEMPLPRREGRFAVWVHNGTAEFLDLNVEALEPTGEDLERQLNETLAAVRLNEKQVELAEAELESLRARIVAEQAKYADPVSAEAPALALLAGKAERQCALVQAELAALEAEQQLAAVESGESPETAAVAAGRKKLAAAKAAVETARTAAATEGPDYQPLGPVYPRTSSGRRLALARWIIDPANPRTARVAVNHIWLRHFGSAIVPTVGNFGVSGQPPSHPELLDWLAAEFMEHGWSMKHLHRLIVTSNTYRLNSAYDAEHPNQPRDPENRFLWRANYRRMEAEVVRDSVLHLAGRLDPTIGGPELDETLGETVPRRSLYFRTTPDNKMRLLELFDLANPNECYRRQESVIPQQSLAMTNSQLVLSSARLLARQLGADLATDDATEFIVAAFEDVLGRRPTTAERTASEQFLVRHAALLRQDAELQAFPAARGEESAAAADPDQRARENLVHVLLNHNDFVTIR